MFQGADRRLPMDQGQWQPGPLGQGPHDQPQPGQQQEEDNRPRVEGGEVCSYVISSQLCHLLNMLIKLLI